MASAVEHSGSEAPVPSVQMNTIGTWQADSVSAGQVEAALSDLRRHEERAAVRTSVLTLVIVVSSVDEAQEHLDVVRHLGARHPSRTLASPCLFFPKVRESGKLFLYPFLSYGNIFCIRYTCQ